jgi:hypothetical protein
VSGVVEKVDVIADELGRVARDCESKHLRNNSASNEAKEIAIAANRRAAENARRLTAIAGEDGKGGPVAENTKDVGDHEKRIRSLETAMTRHDVRLALYASGFAALFATILSMAAHYLTK